MINKEELRLGNWVKAPNGGYGTIRELCAHFANIIPVKGCYHTIGYDELLGIPLSGDILSKCGFIRDGDLFFRGSTAAFFCPIYHRNSFWGLNVPHPPYIGTEFKYLHQLQNLFYALQGVELTFKP
jgi:hypothetical protein